MMMNKRLIGAVSESKKYIAGKRRAGFRGCRAMLGGFFLKGR